MWRTLDARLLRDVGALAAAVLVVGASFGAIAVAEGVPVWLVIAMSTLVFAGGAQFLAIGVLGSGGGAAAALVAALVLNIRHLPFGMTIAGVLGDRWPSRLVGSHLMVDESVAFAIAQRDPARARAAYWACGVALFVAWNVGSLAGGFAGQAIGEPEAFGLDAAFPAGLLALLVPALREPSAGLVALVGAAVALVTVPVLPAGLPVLLALTGLVVVLGRRQPAERPPGPSR